MTQSKSANSYHLSAKYGLPLILRRAVAYLLDIVILFMILAPLGFLIQWLLGLELAQTGPEIARVILWNFSIPAWLYFILSDSSSRGATLGKRLLKLHVVQSDQQQVGFLRAAWRTAVKLIPWEMVHIFGFALSVDFADLSSTQSIGLIVTNVLLAVYVVLLLLNRGSRSLHDFAAQTKVVMVD